MNGNGICDEPTYSQTLDLVNGSTPNVSYEPNQTVIDLSAMAQDPNGCSVFAGTTLTTDDTFGITLFYQGTRHQWDYANDFVVTDTGAGTVQTATDNTTLPQIRLQRGHSYTIQFKGSPVYTFKNLQNEVSLSLY